MEITNHQLSGDTVTARMLAHYGKVIVPRFIVVHYTAGGSAESSIAALDNAKLSAHVVLAREGRIFQCVPFDRRAFHAGESQWQGYTDLNTHSIGIEVCNYGWLNKRGDGKYQRAGATPAFAPEQVILADHKFGTPRGVGWEVYPEAQIQVLFALCRTLLEVYPTIIGIVGHDDISPGRKQDPGPAMPMAMLQTLCDRPRDETNRANYVVAARAGLNVRSGPGSNHAVVKVLASGTRLIVLQRSEPWCAIDLQGDGAIDGYVHGSFLRAEH